jgi:SAM-dependent methyltransferase
MNDQLNACPLCNGNNGSRLLLRCKDELVSGEMFHVEQCLDCGFLYTNPRPNMLNISNYYKSPSYISHQKSPKSFIDKLYMIVRRFMMNRKSRLIKSLVPVGETILDLGCGTGTFLETMKQEGYKVFGVEPGEEARFIAQERGIKVVSDIFSVGVNNDPVQTRQKHHISLPNTDPGPNKQRPDPKKHKIIAEKIYCISLWHVLEHMHDFKEQLKQCYRLLNDEGFLVIAVPMYQSLDAAFYKHHWAAYDLPRHLYHFDFNSLKTAAELSGFSLIKSHTLPFDSYYISILSEAYRKSLPKALAYIRAFCVGLISNIVAASGHRPASSQIFILQKKKRD